MSFIEGRTKTVQATTGASAGVWLRQVPPCLTLALGPGRTSLAFHGIIAISYALDGASARGNSTMNVAP